MTNPEDWDTEYIKELKKHYANDVVNYMFRESDNKFSRPYSLHSLAKLYNEKDEGKYFTAKEVAEKANDLGFEGADNLIEYGLNSSCEAGLVEYNGNGGYRLNSAFREWVIRQTKGTKSILATIKTFKTKNKS